VAAGVVGTLVLVGGLLISLSRTRALLTGWLFFFVAILPTMGVITFTNVIACDKYAYLPAVGLLMTLAWVLGRLWQPSIPPSRPTARQLGILAVVLAVAAAEARGTRGYLVHWRDTETLCRRVLHYAPKAEVAHMELGIVLAERGEWPEAMDHFTEAVRLAPYRPKAQYNLGLAWARQGQVERAGEYFAKAVELRPEYFDARCNLARALGMQGRIDEAITHAREAAALRPDSAEAHEALGDLLALRGEMAGAVAEYRRALRLGAERPAVAADLARILATSQDHRVRNGAEAVRLAEQACRATGFRDPALLDTLAAAYAEAGRFDEAIQTVRRAVRQALAAQNHRLVRELERRAELYEARQPYRDIRGPDSR
jgi:Flp pilus assembly protein TadD